MTTSKPSRRPPATKRAVGPATVDEYFARVPEPGRSCLKKMRAAIRSVVPSEAIETISYQMPAFDHNGRLVWYAAFAEHCSLFPTSAVVEALKHELKDYQTSKGTIRFPIDKPLPIALIKRIVKTRVAQHEGKRRR